MTRVKCCNVKFVIFLLILGFINAVLGKTEKDKFTSVEMIHDITGLEIEIIKNLNI
jgi:hypothetical protein